MEFDGLVEYEAPRDGRSPARVLWEEERREDRLRDLEVRVLRVVRADPGPAWERVSTRLASLLARPRTGPRRCTVVRGSVPSWRSA
ncbi:hypothetical protein SAMN05660642_03748 [Geodermatophilus siccatus]|uniref:Uncharacterized protein n=1 Tax=Geodermatophilus siccatus TaxID=1137991 RepID=A0A1G9XK51_9ACTN|nr:hypothetical protein [Geodermatophilus siccatus]SDM97219.1 hypothetical protein SAMN05660642_03748 [Geodermatophilus siccatus]